MGLVTTTASMGLALDTTAAVEEKRKLRKHFRRFDMLFYLICTLVGLDTVGSVANKGAQGFTWLIFLAVTFFVPYALLTAELGSAFPDEGGSYVWTRLAFGRFVAAVNAVLYWISNPIWLGGSLVITAVATFGTFFTPLEGAWKYLFALSFIWISVAAAILSFNIGKWIPTIGTGARFALLGFFTLSVALYALQHGVHGFGGADFGPTYPIFIAVVPVLFFNYVGFELPSAAGDEMVDPRRDVPYTVFRSAVGAVLLYGAPVLAILLVLPQGRVTNLGGFLDAAKTVFTIYGGAIDSHGVPTLTGAGLVLGDIAAALFILALLSSGTTWLMGSDRAQAVAAYDGAGPRILGTFSARFGTPIAVNLLSGATATILMVVAFHFSDSPNAYFAAVLGLAISTTTIGYLAIFPALIVLRYKLPDTPRPYRVPFGKAGAWVCGVVTTFWALLATVALIWPGFGVGWFGTAGNSDDSLVSLSFAHQRLQYELTQIIPLVLFFAAGVAFYALGTPTRARTVRAGNVRAVEPGPVGGSDEAALA